MHKAGQFRAAGTHRPADTALLNGPQISDRAFGSLLFFLGVLASVYYTVWVLVIVRPYRPSLPLCPRVMLLLNRSLCGQPFVDQDHPFQSLFPEWSYAVKIPAVLFVVSCSAHCQGTHSAVNVQVFITVIATFISLVMIKSRRPKSS